MLKLAEHILDSKAAEFDPSTFVDQYEEAVVGMLKKKQAGRAVAKEAPRAKAQASGGNVIDLLKRSLEMAGKPTRKSPPLQPATPKTKTKARQKAS
jgi:DNA end-binding protein Ku